MPEPHTLAARFDRIAGCRPVLGVDPLVNRREIAAMAKIVPVDPGADDPAGVYRDLADGRLPETVIEGTGIPAVINDALRVAGETARVVLLGSPRGRVEIDPYADVHVKGISVIGAHHPLMTPAAATRFAPFTAQRNRLDALTLTADGSLDTGA